MHTFMTMLLALMLATACQPMPRAEERRALADAQSPVDPMLLPGEGRISGFDADKNRLELVLAAAPTREAFADALEREGYEVASVREDASGLLEARIVKGEKTYGIRMQFEPGDARAKKIDVSDDVQPAGSSLDRGAEPPVVAMAVGVAAASADAVRTQTG